MKGKGTNKVIYSVTCTIGPGLTASELWLNFMVETHIPEVVSKGYLKGPVRIVLQTHDKVDEYKYKVIYTADSEDAVNEYREKHGPELSNKYTEAVGDLTRNISREILPYIEVTVTEE